jgi:DNA-binding transcriptional MocR family regulator
MESSDRLSRVDACIEWLRARLDARVFRPGTRVPSVRALARLLEVSPFTAAEAYARLAAAGVIEARRGSGYYVGAIAPHAPRAVAAASAVDLKWLMQQMLDSGRAARGPGLGVLPPAWLDGESLGASLRAVGREGSGRLLEGGTALGYAPLREVLARRLGAFGIAASAEQIVLTTGITQAIHVALQTLVQPGDTVLVLDPCWFGALGMLALRGARVIGVPCTARGPDLAALEQIAQEYRPRLLLLNSVAQNPTGLALNADTALRIARLAGRLDFHVVEDDIYADLCDPALPRVAAGDGLQRVIYTGGFSKTLAANLRVGFLASSGICRHQGADRLHHAGSERARLAQAAGERALCTPDHGAARTPGHASAPCTRAAAARRFRDLRPARARHVRLGRHELRHERTRPACP